MCQNAGRPAKLLRVADPRSFGCGFAALYHYLPKSSRTATIFGARNLFRRNVSSDNTRWTIPQPCSLINLPAGLKSALLWCGFAALRCIAELHSARRWERSTWGSFRRPAEYNSAIQQIENLRYVREPTAG